MKLRHWDATTMNLELDRLEAERDEAVAGSLQAKAIWESVNLILGKDALIEADGTLAAVAELKSRAEAAEANARRYRWVRGCCASEQAKRIFAEANPSAIDAAIDAAIAAREGAP